jgi:hypothetical protein
MGQTQSCYVCGGEGFLADGRIFLDAGGDEGPRFIGQCPRCQRFICTRHCEKLDPAGGKGKSWLPFGRSKPATVVACCPFDPGTALGDRL